MCPVETEGDIVFPVMEESLPELAIHAVALRTLCSFSLMTGEFVFKDLVMYCIRIESPGTTLSRFESSSAA